LLRSRPSYPCLVSEGSQASGLRALPGIERSRRCVGPLLMPLFSARRRKAAIAGVEVSSSSFIRWCGVAAITGAIAYAGLGLLGRLYISLYSPSEPWDVPPVLGFAERMLPLLLLLGAAAAIAGLHRAQRERYGLVGALASLTAFVGVVLTVVGSVVEALSGPAFGPSLLLLISGLLMVSVGLLALGVATMIAGVLPGWVGALVILGSPPFLLFVPSAFENLFENLLAYETLHPLLAGVAWTLVGYALLRAAVRADPG
jgi:hypothetical protein